MGAKENIRTVEEFLDATREQDWGRARGLLAAGAAFRAAGVPRALGGVLEGPDAIIDSFRQGPAESTFEVRQMFGDDQNVCVIGKWSAPRFTGTSFFRAGDKPFTTWECLVYQVRGGKITEATNYVNWLDVFAQTGLLDVTGLVSK